MRPPRPLVLTLIVPVLAACGSGDGSAEAVVRDSAGIRIVENRAPDGRVAFVVAAEPAVSIGALDGPPEYTFQGVRDAARLPDGGIVVADGSELKYYDASGRHVRTAGGAGEGPGEFTFLATVAACGDEVVAGDMRQQYLSLFDADGDFLRTEPLPGAGNAVFAMTLLGCEEGTGQPVLRVPRPFTPGAAAGTRMEPTEVVRLDTTTAVVDTVGRPVTLVRTGGFPGPFDPAVVLRYDGARFHVLHGDEIAIHTYEDGELARIARLPAEPRPVTPEDQRRGVEATLEGMPEAMRTQLRPRIEQAAPPSHMPAARELLADAAGRLWVQPFTAPWEERASGWLVLDDDGTWLGRVDLPAGFRPLEIGQDWVLGVWQDELDVASVRLYGLEEPE